MLQLLICHNRRLTAQKPSCGERNLWLGRELEVLITAGRLPVKVKYSGCLSQCGRGPNMRLAPAGQFFHNVQPGDLSEIIEVINNYIESQEWTSAVAKEQ